MKQAVILAAGEGQRLRPFTATKSKVMLSIADKPVLGYVVEALAHTGIHKIVVVVGYRKEQVYDYLGAGERLGVEITYVEQEKQLGTAHALARVRNEVEDEFMVLPGDNLIEPNTIADFVSQSPNAVLVKRVENPSRYGVVETEDGEVRRIIEKPGEARNNLVNTGIYAVSRQIFDFIEPELDIPEALNRMVAEGHSIKACETDGTWLDIIYPWDILKLNDIILRRIPQNVGGDIETGVSLKGTISIGKGAVIRSNSYIAGPVVIGAGCDIGPHVCILSHTSIGENVVISPFSQIKNSVIGNDVNIGPGCIIEDSVIDKGCVIQGHLTAFSSPSDVRIDEEYHRVTMGAMMGEGCRLSHGIVAQSGVIVGNYCQVQAMKLITGRLPDRSLVY